MNDINNFTECRICRRYTDESIRRVSPERAQELMNVVIKAYQQLPLEKLRLELIT